MIDLNLKTKSENEDEPLGLVILGSLPFVMMFTWFVLSGL